MILKILKDINHRIFTNEETNVFVNKGIRDELKAEAIKWVKNCCGECKTDNETCIACKRFIEFFDLTEDDLK